MFLRKIFASENKLTWVFIDLLIVIIGVFCAYEIQNYAETQKVNKEKDKVLSALKYELEVFRYIMHETHLGMKGKVEKLREIDSRERYTISLDYRFIEPQYDYQTIEYALNLQNSEIVDFELYDVLQSLFVEVKKIEHVEQLLTETARKYRSLPKNLDPKSAEYQLIFTENRDHFKRFIVLINDRAEISARISAASTNALSLINDRLGLKKVKAIEEELIKNNLDLVENEQEAVDVLRDYFPSFSEEEIREIYREAEASNE